jgi:hypothetical protein
MEDGMSEAQASQFRALLWDDFVEARDAYVAAYKELTQLRIEQTLLVHQLKALRRHLKDRTPAGWIEQACER